MRAIIRPCNSMFIAANTDDKDPFQTWTSNLLNIQIGILIRYMYGAKAYNKTHGQIGK